MSPAAPPGLERAEVVQVARAALAPGAWIVGGIVRDAALGRPLGDLDIVLDGDPEPAARALARATRGTAFSLSEEFGAWRVAAREPVFTCDISPLHGASIEADLGLRDFTVNAVAVPLAGGDAIDPLGGFADIDARRLRMAGPDAFSADPLRPLRLARFAAELGFEPVAATEAAARAAAPRLTEPSPERVYAELRRLIAAAGVLEGIAVARRTGVLAVVLPELEALAGIEQSRFHHLDVLDHTLTVLSELIELTADPASAFGDELGPSLAEILAEPLADEVTRAEALRFGALLHDIAKPETRAVRPDGHVTFGGHARAGRDRSREILTRLRASERMRAFVSQLCRDHLALGFLIHERPLSARAEHGYLRRCEPVEVEVTVLSCADRRATRGAGQEPWIEAHMELGREMLAAALRWRRHGPPEPVIRGDRLAAALGIAPGPEIGPLLAEIEAAVYAGEVGDGDQAVALARSLREHRSR